MSRSRAPTPLIGREREVEQIVALVESGTALITVTGPAGVGKTALALRAVRALSATAWFCDLTDAATIDEAAGMIAATLGARAAPTTIDAALEPLGYLLRAHGPALLVLDNVEHLVAGAAAAVSAWLDLAPELSILVTSRERLRLPSEVLVALGPLETVDAVRLWTACARRVDPEYAIAEGEEGVVATLVRELDGLPLAIELAAARSAILGPTAILRRLDRRFELLEARDAADRRAHSLHGAIDTSWQLLSPAERSVLAQCSIFRGGFTIDAVERVVEAPGGAPVLDTLQALRDKSLVASLPRVASGTREQRLHLYLAIREFAGAELAPADRDAAHARLAEHCRTLVEAAARGDTEADRASSVVDLGDERENVFAAVAWCLSPDAPSAPRLETALRILVALDPGLCTSPAWVAMLAPLDRAMAKPAFADLPVSLRGMALVLRGRLAQNLGQLSDFEAAAELARAANDVALESLARNWVAYALCRRGRLPDARAAAQRSLDLARHARLRQREAAALFRLGGVARQEGETDEARACFVEACSIFRESGGIAPRVAMCRVELVLLDCEMGRYDAAQSEGREVLAALDECSRPGQRSYVLRALGLLALGLGRVEEAGARFADAIAHATRDGSLEEEQRARVYNAFALFELGAYGRAEEEIGAALAKIEPSDYTALFRAVLACARARLGAPSSARALADAALRDTAERSHPQLMIAVRLASAIVDAASAAQADERGDAREAARLRSIGQGALAEARTPAARGGKSAVDCLVEARILARWLDAALAARGSVSAASVDGVEPAIVVVDPQGRFFDPPAGARVELGKRPVMRRLLAALARARVERPDDAVSPQVLVAACWPGERMMASSARNRLNALVSRLRDLGLRDVLVTTDDGYRLGNVAVPDARA